MPKQVLPESADFARISSHLTHFGFAPVLPVRMRQELQGLRFIYPKGSRPGREYGFVLEVNGYAVYVWTTWLVREARAREVDAGWVLITEKGQRLYCSRPIHRTQGFVETLLNTAWIAKFRVEHRPHCEVCGQLMVIARGHVMKQRYWACYNRKEHPDKLSRYRSWDNGLPPRAKAFVDERRRRRKAYQTKRKAAGKPINIAPLIRRPRTVPTS